MHPSDAALVEQCLKGQKNAFEAIVLRYQHRIYHMALIRMRDRCDADDLAQETFLQAYRHLRSYDPTRSFRNWLLSICANLGKNRLRRRARRREVHHRYPEAGGSSCTEDHSRMDLVAGLHNIPEKQRIALFLKHVEGLSYDEVAAVLKIGTSAAKMRVKRGRDQLVQYLSQP